MRGSMEATRAARLQPLNTGHRSSNRFLKLFFFLFIVQFLSPSPSHCYSL